MLSLSEFAIAGFAQFGDVCGALWIDGDWGWWDGRVEGEEGAVEGVEGCKFFLEGAGGGGGGYGFGLGVHVEGEEGEGLGFLHDGGCEV